ncbi:MAG: hypothetical protein AAB152_00090 [Candidatus Coatesbacteria bacterium]
MSRMRVIRLLAGLAVAARSSGALAAQGTDAVNALNKVEAARAQAFGGAAVAIGNDPTLVWLNPAASAQVAGGSITVSAQRGYFGDAMGQALVATPVGEGMLTAGVLYFDAGEGEMYSEDLTQLWRTKLQQDVVGAVGFAAPLSPRVTSGAMLKVLHSRLAESMTASSLTGDVGVQTRVQDWLKLGFAASNIGTPLRYAGDAVASPAALRVGAAGGWRLHLSGGSRPDTLIVVGDAEMQGASGLVSWRGGIEYQVRGMVAVRAGFRAGAAREPSTYCGGVGFRVGAWRLDYTVRYNRIVDLPQTLSLTVALPGGHAASPVTPTVQPAMPAPAPANPALPDSETSIYLPVSPDPGMAPVPPEPETIPPEPRGPSQELEQDLNRSLDELMQPPPIPTEPR